MLRLQHDSGIAQETEQSKQSNGSSDAMPSLNIVLQPLQLMHRSSCLARLQGVLCAMPHDLQSHRVLHAINQIASPAGRALAKAELAVKTGPLLKLHVEVRHHNYCLINSP